MAGLKSYLKEIHRVASRGDAREESYYSTLEGLLKEYAESADKRDIHITTLPKKTEAGNPDFRIWDGKQHIVGYIEAKDPTVKHLDQIETTEQLKRYRKTFPNLILTNFFEFRLYRNGKQIDQVLIGRPFVVHKLKTVPVVEKEGEFLSLLEKFFSFALPKVYDAETLAIELAKRTRFLKEEVVAQELEEEEKAGRKRILGFYEAFRDYLIAGLTKEDFADLYSQTITYGLFAARARSKNGFNRKLAYDNIPRTIGILREVFEFVSRGDPPEQMEWIIDDISEVLAVTDVNSILHRYFHEGKGKDPVVHFYETFLTEYDPETRERRGVYYTPEAVVSYIVRSLHIILKEHFDRPDGFANDSVTVLDPAAGTLSFLAEAAKLAVDEFVSKYGGGGKESFIKDHILKNFYGFELMMAPYAVGHLKMSFLLEELGYKLKKDDRFRLYLTNSLEMEELTQTELPGMASLSEESHLAGKVKKEQPILVILGNPPYSGISANLSEREMVIKKGEEYITHYEIHEDKVNGYPKLIPQTKKAKRKVRIKQKTWIGALIEYYKIIDSKWFGERKHWLHDDYVKFTRFAQWKIDQLGEGILGFITNHSYLDNPTFRGMRQSLMHSFDEIYILDLHGNSLKKEKCPDGSKDENVFDIQQGVAIALFTKTDKNLCSTNCRVYHSEIWGLREKKNEWLSGNDMKTIKWEELSPTSPYYFFLPREEKGRETYEKYWKVTDIFPVNSVGFVTARDRFVIDFEKANLKNRFLQFYNLSVPTDLVKMTFDIRDYRNFKIEKIRKERSFNELSIVKCLYRPFDERYIYYDQYIVQEWQFKVMRHMMHENLGLLFTRPKSPVYEFSVLVSDRIIDQCVVGNKSAGAGISYLAPLYLYPDADAKDLFSHDKAGGKRLPNLHPTLFRTLSPTYKREPTPEDIFYYIYAVLYSTTYRTRYAQFLKIDFARIPFTKDHNTFTGMAEHGKRLVDLHLLKLPELGSPVAKFQGKGQNRVEKLKYDESDKRVYFNPTQYFERITEEVWQYQIGGYQVCSKWLKDRKGRTLSLDDIKHYCKIVTAIDKTIEIQKEIDKIYPQVEENTIDFVATGKS